MQGREENERDDDDGQQKKQVRILLRRCRNRGYHVRFGCGQKCVADREEGRRENEIEGKSWNWQRQAEVTFGWTATQSWSSCGEGMKCSMFFFGRRRQKTAGTRQRDRGRRMQEFGSRNTVSKHDPC